VSEDFDNAISTVIGAFPGEVAFFARNLLTGEELGYRPKRVMPTASTIKLLVLAEFYRQAESGEFDPEAILPIPTEDRRGGSGILKDLSTGIAISARDHATLMTALSDNTSTAVLVRLLGLERILAAAQEWGLTQTTATFAGTERQYGSSTPRDIVRLLELIDQDAIGSPATCAAIRDTLLTQQYHDQIARYLPFSQYNRDGAQHAGPLIVRSKSGFSNGANGGVRTDAGLITLGANLRYAICTMVEGSADRHFGPEHDGAVVNGKISRLVFDAWASA
jgi:beta-lactamase class A